MMYVGAGLPCMALCVAQIFEGPAMDAKRKQREEREQILRERRSLNEMKEDEKLALHAKREAERLLV